MRVSVSEHTGNAKTPKNIVTSDEEDTLSKVRTFEGKEGEFDPLAHNLAEEQKLRLDKYETKPTQDVKTQKAPANTAAVENLQTLKQHSVAPEKQAAPRGSETTANQQNIATDKPVDNRQAIATENLKENLQGIPTEKFQENNQALPASNAIDSNTQSIPSSNVETNIQGIQTESINDNLQSIANDSLENNIQSISSPQVAPQKPQGIAKESIRTNDAGIAKEPVTKNDAGIAKENVEQRDARVAKEQVKTNTANISIDTSANNKQAIQSAPVSDNLASIPKDTHHETRQALDKDSFQDRGATVAKTSVEGNVQAVPTKPSISNNLQPIEQKPIADHFETLPSDPRPLGETAAPKNSPIANRAAPTPPQSVTTKAAVVQLKPSAKPQKVVPSSAISSAEAEKIALAHKAQMEAFHGRLAGIKHNVDALNHKLDDLDSKS